MFSGCVTVTGQIRPYLQRGAILGGIHDGSTGIMVVEAKIDGIDAISFLPTA